MPDEENPAIATEITSANGSTSTTAVSSISEADGPAIQPRGSYEKIADFMGHDPSIGIVPRFGYLNSLNLLYFQAELVNLEKNLQYFPQQDKTSDHSCRKLYQFSWPLLYGNCTDPGSSDDNKQPWETMLRIREMLQKYNDAIISQNLVARMTKPRHIKLDGSGYNVWVTEDKPSELLPEMVAVNARGFEDPATRFVLSRLVWGWHAFLGRFLKKKEAKPFLTNCFYYQHKRVLEVVSVITMSLASTFAIVAIAVLNFISTIEKRFRLMALFTVAFSFCLGQFAPERKVEVFSASAAFAAVQVVFIGARNTTAPAS